DWSGPYSRSEPFHKPSVLFAYIAADAPSLEFTLVVIILPQSQSKLIENQAASVDFLTDGKFRLGVEHGCNAVEFEGLNESLGNRAKRFVEQIDLIRQLTSQETINYRGEWHRIDHAGIRPLGVQRPIPIWIGGSAEVAVRR